MLLLSGIRRRVKDREGYRSAALVALIIAIAAALAASGTAHADRVDRLSDTLRRSKSDKARISAAVALAKLEDRRAVPALAHALRDSNRSVRAIAATALGHIGDPRALKALRRAATDRDPMVRKRVATALARIEKKAPAPRSPPASSSRLARYRVDAKERPLLRPKLHVMLKTASDETRGRSRPVARKLRAVRMKSLMLAAMNDTAMITTRPEEAARLGLRSFTVDVSLLKLDRVNRGAMVEMECEIRLTISNGEGRMISFLTGGARVQVPRRTYRPDYDKQMRNEALENAIRKMHRDLVSFLRTTAS